jgi:periplasmic divalent cation tolerance protein
MNMVFVYVTFSSNEEAKKIANHLVRKKFIACANIYPVNAIYPWEGKIVDDNEFVLICKTTEENFEETKKEIEKLHSFSVPCIIKIPVNANEKYFEWVKKEVK